MPFDKEIHLGFIGPKAIDDAVSKLGLTLTDDDDQPCKAMALEDGSASCLDLDAGKYDALLEQAFAAVAGRLNWTFIGKNDRYSIYDTPYGRRETAPFCLHIQYDPYEVGDEPKDCTFGINLSSRYFPTILDISDPNGGLGPAVDLESIQPAIQICREEITKRIPVFEGARVFFRDIFY